MQTVYSETEKNPHILLIRTDRIGDVILTMPMLNEIKDHYPAARVSMLVQPYTSNLVEGNPLVDTVLIYSKPHSLKSFLHFVRTLKQYNFSHAVLVYPRFLIAFALWLARIPHRIGTGYRWYSFLFNERVYEHRKHATKHEAQYNISLLRPLGCSEIQNISIPLYLSNDELAKGKQIRRDLGIDEEMPFVVLHPGSGGSARDWKAERFASLAKLLAEQNIQVVVTGTAREQDLVEKVLPDLKAKIFSFISTVTLKEFAAFIHTAKVFVANSTGPLHLAAAIGVPVVAFYPPVPVMSPTRWGPMTDKKAIFVPDPSKCTKCGGKQCRGNDCMDQITVDAVYNAVMEFIK